MGRMYIKTDFSEVYKKLERMEKAMQEKIIQETLTLAGEKMSSIVKSKAPVDTGALSSSIDFVVKGDYVEIGVMHPTGRVHLYSVYQEFGTHRMSSQAYFRPSFDEGIEQITQIMLEKILSLLASC